MGALEIIGFVIFTGAVFTATASWVLGVFEMSSVFRLTGKLFHFGLVLFRQVSQVPSARQSIPQGETIKLTTFQLRLVDSYSGIFGPRFSIFGLRPSSHIPIKGTFSWNASDMTMEVRMPFGTTLFFGSWLVAWTTAGVMIGLSPDFGALDSLAFTLFGWAVAVAIYTITLRISRFASERAVAEIFDYLSDGKAISDK